MDNMEMDDMVTPTLAINTKIPFAQKRRTSYIPATPCSSFGSVPGSCRISRKKRNRGGAFRKSLNSSLFVRHLPEDFNKKQIEFKRLWKLLKRDGWCAFNVSELNYSYLYAAPGVTNKNEGVLGETTFRNAEDVIDHVFENRNSKFHDLLIELLHKTGIVDANVDISSSDEDQSEEEEELSVANLNSKRIQASRSVYDDASERSTNEIPTTVLAPNTATKDIGILFQLFKGAEVWEELSHMRWKYVSTSSVLENAYLYAAPSVTNVKDGIHGYTLLGCEPKILCDILFPLQVPPGVEPNADNIWQTLLRNRWYYSNGCYYAPHVTKIDESRHNVDRFTNLDDLVKFYKSHFYLERLVNRANDSIQIEEQDKMFPDVEGKKRNRFTRFMVKPMLFSVQDIWNEMLQMKWKVETDPETNITRILAPCPRGQQRYIGHSCFIATPDEIDSYILPLQIAPDQALQFKVIWKRLKKYGWRKINDSYLAPHVHEVDEGQENWTMFRSRQTLVEFYKKIYLLQGVRALVLNYTEQNQTVVQSKAPKVQPTEEEDEKTSESLTFVDALLGIKGATIWHELKNKGWKYVSSNWISRPCVGSYLYAAPCVINPCDGVWNFTLLENNPQVLPKIFCPMQVPTTSPTFDDVWPALESCGWQYTDGQYSPPIELMLQNEQDCSKYSFTSEEDLMAFYLDTFYLPELIMLGLETLKEQQATARRALNNTKPKQSKIHESHSVTSGANIAAPDVPVDDLSMGFHTFSGAEVWRELQEKGWSYAKAHQEFHYAMPGISRASEGFLGYSLLPSDPKLLHDTIIPLQPYPSSEPVAFDQIWEILSSHGWSKVDMYYCAPHLESLDMPQTMYDRFASSDELFKFYLNTLYLGTMAKTILQENIETRTHFEAKVAAPVAKPVAHLAVVPSASKRTASDPPQQSQTKRIKSNPPDPVLDDSSNGIASSENGRARRRSLSSGGSEPQAVYNTKPPSEIEQALRSQFRGTEIWACLQQKGWQYLRAPSTMGPFNNAYLYAAPNVHSVEDGIMGLTLLDCTPQELCDIFFPIQISGKLSTKRVWKVLVDYGRWQEIDGVINPPTVPGFRGSEIGRFSDAQELLDFYRSTLYLEDLVERATSQPAPKEPTSNSDQKRASTTSTSTGTRLETLWEEASDVIFEALKTNFGKLYTALRKLNWNHCYGDLTHVSFYLKPGIKKSNGTLGENMFGSADDVIQHVLELREEDEEYRAIVDEIAADCGLIEDSPQKKVPEPRARTVSVSETTAPSHPHYSLEDTREVLRSCFTAFFRQLKRLGWSYTHGGWKCAFLYLMPNVSKSTGVFGTDMFDHEADVVKKVVTLQDDERYRTILDGFFEDYAAETALLEAKLAKPRSRSSTPQRQDSDEDQDSEDFVIDAQYVEQHLDAVTSAMLMPCFNQLFSKLKKLGWRYCNGDLNYALFYLKPNTKKSDGVLGTNLFGTALDTINAVLQERDNTDIRKTLVDLIMHEELLQFSLKSVVGKNETIPKPTKASAAPESQLEEVVDHYSEVDDEDDDEDDDDEDEEEDDEEEDDDEEEEEEELSFHQVWHNLKKQGWYYRSGGLESAFVYCAKGVTPENGTMGVNMFREGKELTKYYMKHLHKKSSVPETTCLEENATLWKMMEKDGWEMVRDGDQHLYVSAEAKNSKQIPNLNVFYTQAEAISFYMQKLANRRQQHADTETSEPPSKAQQKVDEEEEEEEETWHFIWNKLKALGWTAKWSRGTQLGPAYNYCAPSKSTSNSSEMLFTSQEDVMSYYRQNRRRLNREYRNRGSTAHDHHEDEETTEVRMTIDDDLFLNEDEAAAIERGKMSRGMSEVMGEDQREETMQEVDDSIDESPQVEEAPLPPAPKKLTLEQFKKSEARREKLDALALKWIGRASQIESIACQLEEPSNCHTLLYGPTSTGKSSIVRDILQQFELSNVIVDCDECYSVQVLYKTILSRVPGYEIPEDEESDEDEVMEDNQYEQLRQKNLAENAALLNQLNIGTQPCSASNNQQEQAASTQAQSETLTRTLAPQRCDRYHDFILSLNHMLESTEGTFHIVLDNAERLRDLNSTLISNLLSINKFSQHNIHFILISNSISTELAKTMSAGYVSCIRFPNFNARQIQQICMSKLQHSRTLDVECAKQLVEITMKLFGNQVRDVRELVRITLDLSDTWQTIRADPTAAEGDMRLLLEPRVLLLMRKLYMHDYAEDSTAQKTPKTNRELDAVENREIAQTTDAPFESKVLLMAGFLASYNSKEENDRIFSTRQSSGKTKSGVKKNGGTSRRAGVEALPQLLLGPRVFLLEDLLMLFIRLLEILYGEKEAATAFNESMYKQVASLVSSGMLTKVSKEGSLDQVKLKCNATLDYVKAVADTLKFDITQYLAN